MTHLNIIAKKLIVYKRQTGEIKKKKKKNLLIVNEK